MVCGTVFSVEALVLDSHIKAAGLGERFVAVDCVELEKDFEVEL